MTANREPTADELNGVKQETVQWTAKSHRTTIVDSDGVEDPVLKVEPIAGKNSDFLFEAAKGNITGYMPLLFTGENEAIGNSKETIRFQGGLYPFPTSAGFRTISSTSINDTAAGTGARTVVVQWLDENFDRVTEILTLNGTTAVTSTVNSIRVQAFQILTAGSLQVADGQITIFNGADDLGAIQAGEGNMRQLVFTVPRNKTWFATFFSPTSAKNDEVAIFAEGIIGGVRFTFSKTFIYQNSFNFTNYPPPAGIGEMIDLEATAINIGAAASSSVAVFSQFMEIDNDEY